MKTSGGALKHHVPHACVGNGASTIASLRCNDVCPGVLGKSPNRNITLTGTK